MKNIKVLYCIICVLLVIILGLGCYLIIGVDRDNSNNNQNIENNNSNGNDSQNSNSDQNGNDQSNNNSNNNNSSSIEQLSMDSELVKKLLTYTDVNDYGLVSTEQDIYGPEVFGLHYPIDGNLAIELSNDTKLKMFSRKIYYDYNQKLVNNNYTINITRQELENSYKALFGSNSVLPDISDWNICPVIQENGDNITIVSNCSNDSICNSSGCKYTILTQFYKAEKTNDEIYIYQYVGYPKYTEINSVGKPDPDASFDIYKDYEFTTKTLGTNTNTYDSNIGSTIYTNSSYNLSKIGSELNTYRYVFKLENNNYYFYSIEKVN